MLLIFNGEGGGGGTKQRREIRIDIKILPECFFLIVRNEFSTEMRCEHFDFTFLLHSEKDY